jgi:hypothetical protein
MLNSNKGKCYEDSEGSVDKVVRKMPSRRSSSNAHLVLNNDDLFHQGKRKNVLGVKDDTPKFH